MVSPSVSTDPGNLSRGHAAEKAAPRIGAAIAAVLLAAACWSFIGIAYRLILDGFDISPVSVVTIRATMSSIVLLTVVLFRPALRAQVQLITNPRVSIPLLGAGLVSVTGFYIVLIYAYEEAGVAVGTVLLYLAPSFVALGTWLVFKQRITRAQRLALVMSFLGVIGVSGVLTGNAVFNAAGVVLGVISAVCYASYSLFGQQLLTRLHPIVLVALSTWIGTIGLWLVKFAVEGPSMPTLPALAWTAIVTGIGTTLVPLLLYTWGLSVLGAKRASLLTTVEPLLAVTLAFIILGETLSAIQLSGGILIVAGVLIAGLERPAD